MSFYYDTSLGFLWVPKSIKVGSPDWTKAVIRSPVCPDQRKYRRMTRAERKLFGKP